MRLRLSPPVNSRITILTGVLSRFICQAKLPTSKIAHNMGRSILAEVPVEQSIKNLLNEKWTIGLLIGQVSVYYGY